MSADNTTKNNPDTTPTVVPSQKSFDTGFNEKYFNVDVEGNNFFRPWTSASDFISSGIATIVLFESKNVQAEGVASLAGQKVATLKDINADGSYIGIFKNFSLTQYGETRQEAFNIQRTFGKDWVAFFFGEQPRTYQYNGHFLDYVDYPHYQQFMMAYDKYLRGTKCIERGMTMYISYDGKLVRGLITQISTSKTSAPGLPAGMVSFNFSILIMSDQFVRTTRGVLSNAQVLASINSLDTK